jgi:hypothetical protein
MGTFAKFSSQPGLRFTNVATLLTIFDKHPINETRLVKTSFKVVDLAEVMLKS